MNDIAYHLPVMLAEVEAFLVNAPDGTYIDATFGGGGHSRYLLDRHPTLCIIALDWDAAAVERARDTMASFGSRFRIVRENFKNIAAAVAQCGCGPVHGVLADLGVSSRQLDDRSRGFSFESENMDMRMDDRLSRSAADLVNSSDENTLADIIYQYGEEHASRRIAAAIMRERRLGKITSGRQLAAVVARVGRRGGKVHPATRVFQALRIAVNGEMDNLEGFLRSLPSVLAPGGRGVVMSYHSLEDRMVKNNFRQLGADGICRVLTKKVVCAADAEVRENPRSRSAKLRCVERI